MAWLGIEGHDEIVDKFRRTLVRGRLASTYLFVGPPGIGKRTFAERLAQTLLCSSMPAEQMSPCGNCPACQQVLAGTHPDLLRVCLPPEKKDIPLEVFIGDREHRSREGFCHDLAMKPFMGGRKVGVIDDADFLNEEGANALLKTLEEPPPKSVLILLGTSTSKQLPTIRSRCQIIRFAPLPIDSLAELLVSQGLAAERSEAERLARYSDGGLTRAGALAAPEIWQFRNEFLNRLAASQPDTLRLARQVASFIEEAGREVPARRARLGLIVEMALEYYRELMRTSAGATLAVGAAESDELAGAVAVAAPQWTGRQDETIQCVEACLDALRHIDRNANVNLVIEHWLDQLARISLGR